MNMKVMSKMAIGGICLAAASLGAVAQGNKNNTGTTVEYNQNLASRINETPDNVKNHTKMHGTNGSSIYFQFMHDTKAMPSASKVIKEISEGISRNTGHRYSANEIKQKTAALQKLQEIASNAEKQYAKNYAQYLSEFLLYGNNKPGKRECDDFLNDSFATLYENLSDKEFDAKADEYIRDVNAFYKKQGTRSPQKDAELLAYKQYKLDSIANGQILETVLGSLMNANVLELYKNDHSRYTGKPKP